MPTPVLCITVLVVTDPFEITDVDPADFLLDTSFGDVFGKAVEKVRTTLRPLVVESAGPITTRPLTTLYFSDTLMINYFDE